MSRETSPRCFTATCKLVVGRTGRQILVATCPVCGRDIMRQAGRKRPDPTRLRLYCPHCELVLVAKIPSLRADAGDSVPGPIGVAGNFPPSLQ